MLGPCLGPLSFGNSHTGLGPVLGSIYGPCSCLVYCFYELGGVLVVGALTMRALVLGGLSWGP